MIEYPVIGMSPGNSYFKDEVIKVLLKKVVDKYGKAAVLIADVPAISTYKALGYPENRAWRDKALPQGNNLRNKVERAMTELGYSDTQVKVVDWKTDIEADPIYNQKYSELRELHETNKFFQESANKTTQAVLESSDKQLPEMESAIKTAVHYLLSELAFMEFAPIYLKSDRIVYIYHKEWPVYESYIAGKFDEKPRKYLGFDIITT
ncbi:MAG: tRNA-dependent cyclodipeptide synthase [Patescibacteria group bacterium]